MNNGISNQPYARAFFTEPMTAGIAFSPEEVDRINALFSSKGTKTSATDGQFIDEKMRISDINFYYPNEQTAWIFEKLNYIIDFNNRDIWNFDLYGYESFQYSEYPASKGGKYDFHSDIDYTDRSKGGDPQTRKLSLSLILNEPGVDFEGGEFQILVGPDPHTCAQAKGMVIVFPFWILHRVTPVTKGNRKSIVVWVTGPKFK